MEMSIPSDLMWLDVASFPVTIEQARLVGDRYFDSSHEWLPVVSRMRLRRALGSALALCGSADFAALLVAMDLLSEAGVISRT